MALVYYIIFFFPAIMSLNYEYEKQLVKYKAGSFYFHLIFIFILIVLIGLRFEVGGDWPPYRWYYERAATEAFADYINLNEVGYAVLNLISYSISGGISFVNFCCAIIFVFALYKFVMTLPRPWLGLVVASPYLIVVIAMGFSRQGVAIALTMYAIKFIKEGKNYNYILFIFFACLFHVSALFLLPLVLLQFFKKNIIYFFISSFVVFLLIFYYFDIIYDKTSTYLELEIYSSGTNIRLLMCFLPACIFVFFLKRFNINQNEKLFWLQMCFLCFFLVALNFIFPGSTIIDRLGFYLISLQMFVYSYLPGVFGYYKRKNKFWVLMINLLYFLTLFVWLNFAKHNYAWIPYKSFLFQYYW